MKTPTFSMSALCAKMPEIRFEGYQTQQNRFQSGCKRFLPRCKANENGLPNAISASTGGACE